MGKKNFGTLLRACLKIVQELKSQALALRTVLVIFMFKNFVLYEVNYFTCFGSSTEY